MSYEENVWYWILGIGDSYRIQYLVMFQRKHNIISKAFMASAIAFAPSFSMAFSRRSRFLMVHFAL